MTATNYMIGISFHCCCDLIILVPKFQLFFLGGHNFMLLGCAF